MNYENKEKVKEITNRIDEIEGTLNLITDLTNNNIVTIKIGVKVADLNTANNDHIKMSSISYKNNDEFLKFITEQLRNERTQLIEELKGL